MLGPFLGAAKAVVLRKFAGWNRLVSLKVYSSLYCCSTDDRMDRVDEGPVRFFYFDLIE